MTTYVIMFTYLVFQYRDWHVVVLVCMVFDTLACMHSVISPFVLLSFGMIIFLTCIFMSCSHHCYHAFVMYCLLHTSSFRNFVISCYRVIHAAWFTHHLVFKFDDEHVDIASLWWLLYCALYTLVACRIPCAMVEGLVHAKYALMFLDESLLDLFICTWV